jgi:hypothetical protein
MCGAYYREKKVVHFRFTKKVKPNAIYVLIVFHKNPILRCLVIFLLQEVGCNHAQSVGFSTDGFATTPTMRKLHLIWVTARMHIEVYKYPAW